jgi:hypothetical protein
MAEGGGVCGLIDEGLESVTEMMDMATIESVTGIEIPAIVETAMMVKRVIGMVEEAATWVNMAASAVQGAINDAVGLVNAATGLVNSGLDAVVGTLSSELGDFASDLTGIQTKLAADGIEGTEVSKLTREAKELTVNFKGKWGDAVSEYGTDIDDMLGGVSDAISTGLGDLGESLDGALDSVLGDCSNIPNISIDGSGIMDMMPSVPTFPISFPTFDVPALIPLGISSLTSEYASLTSQLGAASGELESMQSSAFENALSAFKLTDKFDGVLSSLPDISNISALDLDLIDDDIFKMANAEMSAARDLLTPQSLMDNLKS